MQWSTGFTFLRQGKVREVYAVDDHHLLIVASDRMSALGHVLPNTIAGKGIVLTHLSSFWFERPNDRVSNHDKETI